MAARPRWHERDRVGRVGGALRGSIRGQGRRRWRALDLGMAKGFVEAEAPRVRCPEHRVVVCSVPWARHASRFTLSAEEQICCLAVHTSKTAVAELMRVAWRTVGDICERVLAEADQADGDRWMARGASGSTCSRSSNARSSVCLPPTRSPCSTSGSPGPEAADCRPSCASRAPSPTTGPGSPPPCSTGSDAPLARRYQGMSSSSSVPPANASTIRLSKRSGMVNQ